MTTKEILQKAEQITISYIYGDGTYLFDVLCEGKAFVIRQYLETVNRLTDSK